MLYVNKDVNKDDDVMKGAEAKWKLSVMGTQRIRLSEAVRSDTERTVDIVDMA